MREFAGRRIVITGAGGPVGVAIARQLMTQGGHVVLVDASDDRLQQAREGLGPVRLATLRSDVATPTECERAIDAAGAPAFALIHVIAAQEPPAAIGRDLAIAYDLANAFTSRFDQRGPARLVFVIIGATAATPGSHVLQRTVRDGIAGMTRSLATRLAPHILVNAVTADAVADPAHPAPTADSTDNPLGRDALPAEVASVVCFLCAADSSFVNGQVIAVDGGRSAL